MSTNKIRRLCVYCGSNSGTHGAYPSAAKDLANAMVEQDIELIYGGASVGLMGTLADEVLRLGGTVTGVIPQSLVEKEVAHSGLSELKVVSNMHQRKALMSDMSDGFVALPGGLGTLEELFEMLTWAQLGFHRKPCAVFNIHGYFDGLLDFIRHTVSQGFVKQSHSDLLIAEEAAGELIARMNTYQAIDESKWSSVR